MDPNKLSRIAQREQDARLLRFADFCAKRTPGSCASCRKSRKKLYATCPKCLLTALRNRIADEKAYSNAYLGKIAEFQVGQYFARKGYEWLRAKDSNGPADLIVWHSDSKKPAYAIQVKASALGEYRKLSRADSLRLRNFARTLGVIPAHALVNDSALSLVALDGLVLETGELHGWPDLHHVFERYYAPKDLKTLVRLPASKK